MSIVKLLAHPGRFRHTMSWYPPFWGTGISVSRVADDFRFVRVIMKARFYNINAIGVHFGGSMCAMTDPFFMLMLQQILGRTHKILDASSCIEFLKPGRGTLTADHQITNQDLTEIENATASGDKFFKPFSVDIIDEHSDVVARVEKQVYVRLRQRS